VKFFNAAGDQITHGSTNDDPFAAFAVGLTAPRAGDPKATLIAFVPTPGQTPDVWTASEQIGLSTVYPNNSAPSPIKDTALPVNTGGSGDLTLGTISTDIPQSSTATGYANVYELRLYTSAFGLGAAAKYDYTDITIDPAAHTWTQIYTPSGDFPPPPSSR